MKVARDMLQIIHFSDCHLYPEDDAVKYDINTASSLSEILETASLRHPAADLAICSGDIAEKGDEVVYTSVAKHFSWLPMPIFVIPGNHDRPDLLKKHLPHGKICWQRSLNIGVWRLIFLDSTRRGTSTGWLRRAELEALEVALASEPERPTVVILHHPPVFVDTKWLDEMSLLNAGDFWTVLDRYIQVKAVLFGHLHFPVERRRKATILLGAPGTAWSHVEGVPDKKIVPGPAGYRWLNLYSDGHIESGLQLVR